MNFKQFIKNKNNWRKLLKRPGKRKIFSKKSFFDVLAVLLVLQLILPSLFFFLLAGPEARAALLMTHTTTSDFSSGVAAQTVVASNNVTLATQEFGDGSDGAATISSDKNINTDLTTGLTSHSRTCADGADAVNYSVTALATPSTTNATLSATPQTGCLAAGDEVLLINLKGTSTNYNNAGKYEFLIIDHVTSNVVYFTTAKNKSYGNNAGDETSASIGAVDGDGKQKVMIQRVPNYTNVTVNWGYNLTCSAWNGVRGGVLAFRASGTVMVGNTTTGKGTADERYAAINANEKGYRGGTGTNSLNYAPAGETHFGGLHNSGGKSATVAPATPAPGGGGGGGSTGGFAGSSGTTGTAGGGGGSGQTDWPAPGGGGGGGGYGSVGSGASGCGTPTAASGTTGGNGAAGQGGCWPCPLGAGAAAGGGTHSSSAQLNSAAYLGAGGGAGGSSGAYDGNSGGKGGGIIFIGASTLNVSYDTYTYSFCCDGYCYDPTLCYADAHDYGSILSGGQNGISAPLYNNGGGGGGGAGGSVVMLANTFNNEWSGGVTANGGGGGVSTNNGGAGGGGRTYAAYNSFSGSDPATNYAPSAPLTIHYNPSGTFTGMMNAQRTGVSWDALSWQTTQLASTAIAFKARSYGATQSNPDFSSCTTLGTANSGSPNGSASLIGNSCVGNQQYLYYQGSFSTPSPYTTTPSLDQIDVGHGFPDVKIGGFVKYLGNIIFK